MQDLCKNTLILYLQFKKCIIVPAQLLNKGNIVAVYTNNYIDKMETFLNNEITYINKKNLIKKIKENLNCLLRQWLNNGYISEN